MDAFLLPLFASDLARDVRSEYDQTRGYGLGVAEATSAVLASFGALLNRPDEGPVIIIVLAALQLRDHALHASFREAALGLLHAGHGFASHPGEPSTTRHQRDALRLALIAALETAPVVTDGPGDE